MERFTVEVSDEAAARALREEAAAHGRSVEAELEALVERTYTPATTRRNRGGDDNWVEDLIRLGRGLDLKIPSRTAERIEPPDL